MDMETPVWLIAIVAVIAVLVWIGLELRHQRKNPGASLAMSYKVLLSVRRPVLELWSAMMFSLDGLAHEWFDSGVLAVAT